jgi:hypothetical protein
MYGMLWYDGDTKRPLEEKVQRAKEYFQLKYNQIPTWCQVGTPVTECEIAGMTVTHSINIQPDYFLVGSLDRSR